MKINPSVRVLLILFILLSSAILTPSEYTDCRNCFPDEILDFLGSSEISQKPSPGEGLLTIIALPSGPQPPCRHGLSLTVFSLQPTDSIALISTILNC